MEYLMEELLLFRVMQRESCVVIRTFIVVILQHSLA